MRRRKIRPIKWGSLRRLCTLRSLCVLSMVAGIWVFLPELIRLRGIGRLTRLGKLARLTRVTIGSSGHLLAIRSTITRLILSLIHI